MDQIFNHHAVRSAKWHFALCLGLLVTASQQLLLAQVQPDPVPSDAALSQPRPAWLVDAERAHRAVGPLAARSQGLGGGFEENAGQFDGDARFLAPVGTGIVLLRPNAITTIVAPAMGADEPPPSPLSRKVSSKKSKPPPTPRSPTRIDLQLIGAADVWTPKPVGLLPHATAYFRGKDPKAWIQGVPSYERVIYGDVYSGIDLAVYRDGGNVKYDFIVSPGASPSRIRMKFDGAERVSVNASGDLVISAGDVELRHQRPVIFQERDGERTPIGGGFAEHAGVVTFNVGDYDPKLPLIIDPTVVQRYASTLFGLQFGSAQGLDVAVGPTGDVFMVGWANR